MRKRNICGLLLCVTFVFCLALAPTATAASAEEEVLQVATNFVKAINESNSELFSSVYYQSPKTTYFNPWGRFLNRGWMTMTPPGVTFVLSHPEVTMLGDNAAVITGYFTVSSVPQGMSAAPDASGAPDMSGAPELSGAQGMSSEFFRETLVVQKIKGEWLIVHEHCSPQP